MGTLRMPTIPGLAGGFARGDWPQVEPMAAAEALAKLFSKKNTAVLTGAGVSVDSGIRAYRGPCLVDRMIGGQGHSLQADALVQVEMAHTRPKRTTDRSFTTSKPVYCCLMGLCRKSKCVASY